MEIQRPFRHPHLFQLRSEETGITLANSIREALAIAEKDRTIWKISFDSTSGERIRLVRLLNVNDEWVLQLMP